MWTSGAKRMSILSNFIEKVKDKKAEMDERREFMDMVNEESKPFRRAAYMKESIQQSVAEGVAKAKADAKKRMPKEVKKPEDFGIKKENDPWAFLDNMGIVKENDKTLTKLNKKK